jgi:tRNA(Met) C34 N-acetyltransferase TmcA
MLSVPSALLYCLQTVQYIQPQHANRLTQAELLVIDEAAAIPLPLVKVCVCNSVQTSA